MDLTVLKLTLKRFLVLIWWLMLLSRLWKIECLLLKLPIYHLL